MTRSRWLGATGVRVPEIAVEGEEVSLVDGSHVRLGDREVEALVVTSVADGGALARAHEQGVPVVVRADDADAVAVALARPEVACVLVPPERRELRDLDLRRRTYG